MYSCIFTVPYNSDAIGYLRYCFIASVSEPHLVDKIYGCKVGESLLPHQLNQCWTCIQTTVHEQTSMAIQGQASTDLGHSNGGYRYRLSLCHKLLECSNIFWAHFWFWGPLNHRYLCLNLRNGAAGRKVWYDHPIQDVSGPAERTPGHTMNVASSRLLRILLTRRLRCNRSTTTSNQSYPANFAKEDIDYVLRNYRAWPFVSQDGRV